MNDMLTYNQHIALIMEGKTPVARVLATSDSTRTSKVLVMPSPEDSLLRAQMEGDGEYAIAGRSGGSRRSVREAIELAKPVEGIITDRFDIRNGNFGVRIAAAASDRIAAVDNGTVVLSLWTPETGYMVELQHAGTSSRSTRGFRSRSSPRGRPSARARWWLQRRGGRGRGAALRIRTLEQRQARRPRRIYRLPRMKQRLAILGSTGSIGVQTLDIVRETPSLSKCAC